MRAPFKRQDKRPGAKPFALLMFVYSLCHAYIKTSGLPVERCDHEGADNRNQPFAFLIASLGPWPEARFPKPIAVPQRLTFTCLAGAPENG